MKKNVLVVLGFIFLVACNSRSTNENANETNVDSTDMAMVNNNNKNEDKDWEQKDIMEFIEKASSGGIVEVELGKAAQKNAITQQVKDLGKLIEKEHMEANESLKKALKAMQLNAPTALSDKYKDKIERVKNKTGKDFDKEYIDYLVDDHEEDIENFEKAQTKLPESELKTWVSSTLPILRKHLAEAKYIQKQEKNEK